MLETILELIPFGAYLARLILMPIVLTVHGFAHAAVALAVGDSTAKEEGFLTLNPFRHTPGISLILGVLIGCGWNTYVPMRPHRANIPQKLAGLLTVLAGPLANIAMIFGSLAILNVLGGPEFGIDLVPTTRQALTMFVRLNVSVLLINLLPLYPMDMYNLIRYLLPARPSWTWHRVGGRSTFVLAGLVFILMMMPVGIFRTFVLPIVRTVVNGIVFG